MFVLDRLPDMVDVISTLIHVPSFERDVLAHGAFNAVIIVEAVKIVSVVEAAHAPAIAGQLGQNFRDFASRFVSLLCLAGELGRVECGDVRFGQWLALRGLRRFSHCVPDDCGGDDQRTNDKQNVNHFSRAGTVGLFAFSCFGQGDSSSMTK